MPLISSIGSRSIKVRLARGAIFAVLLIGSATMIYPLLLMVSGSVESETDYVWASPFPEYLVDDRVLWMKYVESKYSWVPAAEVAFRRSIGSWRALRPPDRADRDTVETFRAFRAAADWPVYWYSLGHIRAGDLVARNARVYRRACERRFGDIAEFSRSTGIGYKSWSQVAPPPLDLVSRRFAFSQSPNYLALYRVKAEADRRDWVPVNLDGDFQRNFLLPQWGTIAAYNQAHGTSFGDYREVLLAATAPEGGQAREDWETYVRGQLSLGFIRIGGAAEPAFRDYVRDRYAGRIDALNVAWGSAYRSFNQVKLPAGLPQEPRLQVDLGEFVKKRRSCPLEMLSVYGPRQAFEQFVASRRGVPVQQIGPLPLPIEAADYEDFQELRPALRWEFLKRNYLAVFDYLLLHGNGIRNTVIFCLLMVGTQLLVNPLAAYALSRYQLPSTYSILLFCMATMAFPAEVTMIPSFLLLKRFPLYSLAGGFIIAGIVVYLLHRLRPGWPDWWKVLFAGAAGIVAGYWLAPWFCHHVLGRADTAVSLLNTFWALVLPGMANGFSIFLLKGFFDSLPRELYEAADLDGAGEWTKFWLITMNLSKPVLAVLGLGAFTAAYSEFMMALVIIPDQSMWTMMVWLYQLQSISHPTVVYASLVVAAVPTFLVFILCQNLIMRGMVVPTER